MLENNNKVAIITGASSGIGYATSLALSKAGVRVAVGARRIDRLRELEKQIIENGEEGRTRVAAEEIFIQQKLDVTNKSDCDSFVDTAPGSMHVTRILYSGLNSFLNPSLKAVIACFVAQ